MTAKHSPATSLPWTYNDPYRGNIPQPENPRKVNIYSDGYEAVSCAWVDHRGTDRAKANAAYIVHAANAYPKLVEMLKCPPWKWPSAEALLRELGELQ